MTFQPKNVFKREKKFVHTKNDKKEDIMRDGMNYYYYKQNRYKIFQRYKKKLLL